MSPLQRCGRCLACRMGIDRGGMLCEGLPPKPEPAKELKRHPEQAPAVRAGALIVVEYGRGGEQIARISSVQQNGWMGAKWRKNSRTWTKLVRIYPSQFMRIARATDIKRAKCPAEA